MNGILRISRAGAIDLHLVIPFPLIHAMSVGTVRAVKLQIVNTLRCCHHLLHTNYLIIILSAWPGFDGLNCLTFGILSLQINSEV